MKMLTLAALLGLSLTAESNSVLAQSRTIVPEAKPGTPAPAGFYADSWAVVIGINDYQHPRIPKLRYAVNDARSVERALLAQGFRRDRIITLIERQATKAAGSRKIAHYGQIEPKVNPLAFSSGIKRSTVSMAYCRSARGSL